MIAKRFLKAGFFRRAGAAMAGATLAIAIQGCGLHNLHGPRIERHVLYRFLPRPSDYPIVLSETTFVEPHIAIATVTTRPYDDRLVESLGKSELRKTARRLGGDGVIRITRNSRVVEEFGYRPGNLLRYGPAFVDKVSLTGIVVRFKREENP